MISRKRVPIAESSVSSHVLLGYVELDELNRSKSCSALIDNETPSANKLQHRIPGFVGGCDVVVVRTRSLFLPSKPGKRASYAPTTAHHHAFTANTTELGILHRQRTRRCTHDLSGRQHTMWKGKSLSRKRRICKNQL